MSHLAMTYPGFGPGGMGISWTRLAASRSSELNYSENTYTFAYGKKVTDQFAVGSAINFYRLLADVAGSGYSMNFSARYIHNEYLTFGLLWHNGLQTPIRYEGSAQDDLMRDVRVGIAYEPTEWALVSFDVDNLVRQQPKKHLGVECDVLDYPIALRGGISEKTAEGFNWVYSFGGTIKFKKMALDYAVENHFDLGITHLFALRMKF
jgi:hypothetical protein